MPENTDPTHTFTLNGKEVSVQCPDDLRLLWVLRDLLDVRGPKYGCGLDVCKACTSHFDGEAFNPCSVEVKDVEGHRITTIEGLADGDQLHPVQQAWIDYDVAQCGYCQPGQIMAAVALIEEYKAKGQDITAIDDAALDTLRNICRCGTYYRIREAIVAAAAKM